MIIYLSILLSDTRVISFIGALIRPVSVTSRIYERMVDNTASVSNFVLSFQLYDVSVTPRRQDVKSGQPYVHSTLTEALHATTR